jgi:glycosyltransferase involved in cell wall biosynthesis
MKITLKDQKPYPVWLVPKGERSPGVGYYRAILPARMTGGRIVTSLKIIDNRRAVRDFDIFSTDDIEQLLAMPQASILGLGDPTVIAFRDSSGMPVETISLLQLFREAGARVCFEADDDFSASEDRITEILENGLRRNGEIPRILKEKFPSAPPQEIDRWWQDDLHRMVTKNVTALSKHWPALYRAASGVICSTEILAAAVERDCGAGVVTKVAPNVIDPADFPAVPRSNDGIVRVGYVGTANHHRDMTLAWPGMVECSKLPNVVLVLLGWHPRWKEVGSAPGDYSHEGVPYTYLGEFKDFFEFQRRAGILDIAVAPLIDDAFNNSRSPQKWFEHAMHGTATVVSDSPVYECVTRGVDGFKAKDAGEFTHYLRLLVENAELRRRMGEAAHNTVMTRYTVNQWADHWRRAISGDDLPPAAAIERELASAGPSQSL